MGENSNRIVIGENCMLSRDISINTTDFHSIIDMNLNKKTNPDKNVLIGNHVWIGNRVYVNKDATIGANSIVAAKSVVPGKFFEENSIIGGIPAKVIKEGVTWDRRIL